LQTDAKQKSIINRTRHPIYLTANRYRNNDE